MLRLLLLFLVLISSCASPRKAVNAYFPGSCQSVCEEKHPDSLYDRNKCLEDCEP